MGFVESIWSNQGSGFLNHRFSTDNALEVLHKANYSLSRAKFYIQFPILYQMAVTPCDLDDSSRL